MIDPKDYFEVAMKLHGHKCPAMPLGLRVGAAAMNRLGVDRSPDGQLLALVEVGSDHFATCFADGVQMITGCTFGKGNIQKLNYGKWGLTLIDKARQKAVRVVPRAEVMLANKQSTFFTAYRSKGVPASQVPAEHVEPLVERVLSIPEEQLVKVGEVVEYPYVDPPTSFDSFVCESCGEITVEGYGQQREDGGRICLPCAAGESVTDSRWTPKLK